MSGLGFINTFYSFYGYLIIYNTNIKPSLPLMTD